MDHWATIFTLNSHHTWQWEQSHYKPVLLLVRVLWGLLNRHSWWRSWMPKGLEHLSWPFVAWSQVHKTTNTSNDQDQYCTWTNLLCILGIFGLTEDSNQSMHTMRRCDRTNTPWMRSIRFNNIMYLGYMKTEPAKYKNDNIHMCFLTFPLTLVPPY